ncbi:MAG: choice-of-anchor tandem repeat GloVer-containing protein, partial [Verrucomicrobiota bacterium]
DVGFLNPAIYAIGQSPAYTSAFHDITTGNNTNSTSVNEFFAVPGYDLCTGWGTPNGTNLISALRPAPDALQIIPETSIAFNGLVNGPFSPATQTFYLINHGTNTLNWSLGNTSVWFSASPASGSLPAGATAPVTITPTASADTLPAGQSVATLFFANLNNGFSLNRQMVLNVANPVEITAGVVFSNLYSFTGGDDGGNPNGLIQNTNGLFYGTTQNGGNDFAGTIFQITTNGSVTSLYSFTGGNDGANPFATLAQGPDGNFYGSAFQGGADDNGTVFRITTNGVLDTLVTFGITNGDLPFAGLTLGADTNFYGTSHQGGAYGHGTVFQMTTNGTQDLLYSFSGGSDGNEPSAGLVQGGNGNFYGTTRKGGAYGDGAIFSISTNGDFATLYSFDETNGAFPTAGLTEDSDGNFYGVAAQGGAYNSGILFEITPAGLLTNLYSFTGGTDGGNPDGTLVQGA